MHIIVDFFFASFPSPSFYIVDFLLLLLGMSNSLRPGGLQHTRLPCPSLSPRVFSTHVHWVSNTTQPSHPRRPLILLPSIFQTKFDMTQM